MPNYDSLYKRLANQTTSWLSGDTSELYEKNLIKRYDELKKNNWIDTTFTYKFNSLGFRCNEFTQDPSIMFLGCSFTVGIGLPVQSIWPELVSNQLKMNCANFGIGGGSPDTAFRLCHGYIDKIKPKLVIFMIPPSIRFENVNDNQVSNVLVSNPQYSSFYKNWAIDDNNSYFNREKNILGLKMLCKERDIKLIIVDYNELNCADSLARDLSHCGIESHSIFSKKLLDRI
jgi:hypothetical protein